MIDGLGFEDEEEAAHGGGAALEDVGDEAERDHGEGQLSHVGVEGDEFAEGNLALDDLASAEPEHQNEGHANQRLQRRHEHAPGGNELEVARDVLAIGGVKAAHLGGFLGVGAHHAHAGEIFLGLGGERGKGGLDLFVERVNGAAEFADGKRHDGHGDEYPQTQRRARA